MKIGSALADGPAILAAPGVDVFMGNQVGDPAFAAGTVDEVALAHAVEARGEMLQSQVAQLVAARDQEMKLGVMAGSEQGPGLADHPAVELDNFGCELESRRRFGCKMKKRGRIGPGR